ncbi:hypothetical protein NM897_13320 [Planococcus maritimus]|uniref:hypothetical protein n=1 Tax=Planococcus maritimus TaxID=192421 RepID=UPI00313A0C1B
MVRFLVLIMVGAIALAIAYFSVKSVALSKKVLVVGGGLAAALAAIALQGDNPFYMPLLAILGVALLATLVYMKLDEKQQFEQQRYVKERKMRIAATTSSKTSRNQFNSDPVNSGKEEQ